VLEAGGTAEQIGAVLADTLREAAERHRAALERAIGWSRALEVACLLLSRVEAALPACVWPSCGG
jgi:hypothetical protein